MEPTEERVHPARTRPLVARKTADRGIWLFAAMAVFAAIGLFALLEARRAEVTSPATAFDRSARSGMIAAPPDLAIPDSYPAQPPTGMEVSLWQAAPRAAPAPPAAPLHPPSARPVPPRLPPEYDPPDIPSPARPNLPSGPGIAYPPGGDAARGMGGTGTPPAPDRVQARYFANPATSIPKGAVIQAVLETALDSTQAGAARAIVSRDVLGFDGSRVLIPRGSRLYGEYKADISAGQRRALIQWQRLMRPDGAMVDIDSPSADPLGRAGVRGNVNTHFFQRFSGAILQSALDLGVALAAPQSNMGTVVVGLPGNTQNLNVAQGQNIRPTIKVPHGTPVSVFVARDLDFTAVER